MSSPSIRARDKGRGRGASTPNHGTPDQAPNQMKVVSRVKVEMHANAGKGKQWKKRPGSVTRSLPSQSSVESTDAKEMGVDVNVNAGRGKQWKRRPSSAGHSLMTQSSVDSTDASQTGQFVDVEEEYLHAAEFGDIHNVKRIIHEFRELNIDCIDALGRTALRLAVKNEHLEVVEVLLEKSDQHHICEAVLQAISSGHTQIAETILKHRRYLEMWKELRKLGDTDGFYKTPFPDSQFSPDISPLILASQKNQYEIVQLLLLRGETIHKPHKSSCSCLECRNRIKFDQLRLAKYRLNAYRGLASDAYISLSSTDPILTAFELAAELRRLSKVEKHFKREYRDLADQLSDYVVKLLDRIRTQKELELVLNKTGRHDQEMYSSLARFKLALQFKEKKFVAHPSCQQRVVRTWYNGVAKLEHATWPRRLLMTSLFITAYPLLVFLHVALPNSKGAKVLEFPVCKFLSQTMSFLAFLILVVVSTAESSGSVSRNRTLLTEYNQEHVLYNQFRAKTNNTVYGTEFPLRPSYPSSTELLLSLWIVGMVCQECNQLFQSGISAHISDLFNLQDFLLLSVYTATFTLKYWTMYKFHQSMEYLRRGDFRNENLTLKRLYWLNADRMFWTPQDPINLAEGQFAIANILSFSRISYLLPADEILGPLQISLGRMLKDIGKFLALFVLVLLAFIVGLHNLFWYYSERDNIELHLPDGPHTGRVKAAESFGGVLSTFRSVFWSLFGRGEPNAVGLGGYNNDFTQDIGYIIYGAYNMLMVTVLLNMLIAMMTRSFTLIAEDSDREWKFARSQLYMDYIRDGGTLPVPLNIIGGLKKSLLWLIDKLKSRGSSEGDENDEACLTEEAHVHFDPRPPGRAKGAMSGSDPSEWSSSVTRQNSRSDPSSVDNTSEMDTHETSGRVNAGFEGTPSKSTLRRNAATTVTMETEERLTYQQTMQRIVQRYIFDIQRQAEVTEDDFEEIKQDISSFRYDLFNQVNSKQALEEDINVSTVAVMEQLQNLRQRFLSGLEDDQVKGRTVGGEEGGQVPCKAEDGGARIHGSQDVIGEVGRHLHHTDGRQINQQVDRQNDQEDDQEVDQEDDQEVDQEDDQQVDQEDDQQVDQEDDQQVDREDDQEVDQQDDQVDRKDGQHDDQDPHQPPAVID